MDKSGRSIRECYHCHLLKPTHGHGYCSRCYDGLRKNSSFIPYNLRPNIPKFTPCSVWDCNEQIRIKIHVGLYAGKSYCMKHGNAIKQYGEPLDKINGRSGRWYFPEPKEPYIPPKCDIKHCNSKTNRRIKVGLYAGKSYCQTHSTNLFDLGAPIDKRKSCSIDGIWIFPEDGVQTQKCSVKGCGEITRSKIHVGLYAGSYCDNHGRIIKLYGEPITNGGILQGVWRFPESIVCSVDWCNSYVIANGFCATHNQLNSIHGNPEPHNYQCCIEDCQNKTMFMNDKTNGFCLKHKDLDKICIVQDCDKAMWVGGRCQHHYGMYKRYGSFMKMIPFPEDMYCQVQGCNSICMNSGGVTGTGRNKIGYRFCRVHYSRMDTNGITELLPLTVTRPMKIFEAQCNKYGITIDEKEKKIGIYPVDYVIKNIVVQIDGNFYHANPKPYSLFTNVKAKRPTSFKGYKSNDMIFNRTAKEIWAKDKRRDKVVREAGYEVIRFWESDIIMKPEQCIKYLLSRLEFTLRLYTRII